MLQIVNLHCRNSSYICIPVVVVMYCFCSAVIILIINRICL